jgi:hypothetical protein
MLETDPMTSGNKNYEQDQSRGRDLHLQKLLQGFLRIFVHFLFPV